MMDDLMQLKPYIFTFIELYWSDSDISVLGIYGSSLWQRQETSASLQQAKTGMCLRQDHDGIMDASRMENEGINLPRI